MIAAMVHKADDDALPPIERMIADYATHSCRDTLHTALICATSPGPKKELADICAQHVQPMLAMASQVAIAITLADGDRLSEPKVGTHD